MTTLNLLVDQDTVLPQMDTACQAKLDASRPWHSTVAVRTGPVIVGVRSDTAETAEWLEQALAPIRAPEYDASVSPTFSVTLGDARRRETLLLAYHDHEIVARRRVRSELLEDLVELLDEGTRLFVADAAVVHGSAVWGPRGEAVLIPGHQHSNLLMRRAQLESAGLSLGRSRSQVVDLRSMELRLPCVDPALDELRRTHATAPGPATVPRVTTWCIPAAGEETFELRPPEAVLAGVGMVLNRQVAGMRTILDGLAVAVRQTRFVALPSMTTGALAGTVARLVS